VSVERRELSDHQRRALWLGVAVAVVIALGGGGGGFTYFVGGKLHVWLFVANRVALGLSLLLCLVLVVPELRSRLGARFRSEPTVFAWAFAALVLALLLAIASGIEAAIDSLDEDLPFD
jgi:hypothetical protein